MFFIYKKKKWTGLNSFLRASRRRIAIFFTKKWYRPNAHPSIYCCNSYLYYYSFRKNLFISLSESNINSTNIKKLNFRKLTLFFFDKISKLIFIIIFQFEQSNTSQNFYRVYKSLGIKLLGVEINSWLSELININSNFTITYLQDQLMVNIFTTWIYISS